MIDIKPIETIYNGYRFRSRLEARWAVFFDTLGIKYEYELEGFDLPSGNKYLPDFYLPGLDLWIEVKPSRDCDDRKVVEFAYSLPLAGGDTLIVYGDPAKYDYRFLSAWESDDSGGGCYDSDDGESGSVVFTKFPVEGDADWILLLAGDTCLRGFNSSHVYTGGELAAMVRNAIAKYDTDKLGNFIRVPSAWDAKRACKEYRYKDTVVHKAAIKARQVRFEHGEKP